MPEAEILHFQIDQNSACGPTLELELLVFAATVVMATESRELRPEKKEKLECTQPALPLLLGLSKHLERPSDMLSSSDQICRYGNYTLVSSKATAKLMASQSEEMQRQAVEVAEEAMSKFHVEKDIAQYIKKEVR